MSRNVLSESPSVGTVPSWRRLIRALTPRAAARVNVIMSAPTPRWRLRVEQPRGRAHPPWVQIVVGAGLAVVAGAVFLVFSFVARVERAFPGPARAGTGDGALDPLVSWIVGLFVAVGVLVAGSGAVQAAVLARRASRRTTGSAPWLVDHPWDRERALDEAPREGRRALLAGALMAAGAGVFAAFFWSQTRGSVRVFVASAAGLLAAGALAAAAWGLHRLVRRARHGRLELRFGGFPFFLGRALEAELLRQGEAALGPVEATLRCVQEVRTMEHTGDGSGWTIERQEAWSDTRRIDLPDPHARRARIRFPLPDAPALSTELSANPPRYWELEVTSTAAGVDLGATFLVPVYAPARAAAADGGGRRAIGSGAGRRG